MKKLYKLSSILFEVLFLSSYQIISQNAKVQIDKNNTYQKDTACGGFVSSQQFGYNYMSVYERKKIC